MMEMPPIPESLRNLAAEGEEQPQLCDTSAKGMSEAEELRDALASAIR
jgi:hypothetical protein